MEQQVGSKSGKEYVKAVYCHPAYLTSMQSTSCKMPGWMNHKLESRLPGEISVTNFQMRNYWALLEPLTLWGSYWACTAVRENRGRQRRSRLLQLRPEVAKNKCLKQKTPTRRVRWAGKKRGGTCRLSREGLCCHRPSARPGAESGPSRTGVCIVNTCGPQPLRSFRVSSRPLLKGARSREDSRSGPAERYIQAACSVLQRGAGPQNWKR